MSNTTETNRDEIREAVDKLSDETVSHLLKASIARESNKAKKSESKDQYIVRIESQRSMLSLMLRGFLDRFEAIWDRVYVAKDLPEDLISYQEMAEYCQAARYMAKDFDRNHNYVFVVEQKMNEMDIDDARKRNQGSLFEYFKDLKV